MKAFWWFQQNFVAGMARPGFNSCRWFDLPLDEALVMGWLGQHSAGPLSLTAFRAHVQTYLPKTISFYQVDESAKQRILADLENHKTLESIVNRLSERSKFFTHASINNDHLHFQLNRKQVDNEIAFLKDQKINRIVSLTEDHHLKDDLANHFQLDHISIVDMGAPTKIQAQQLAEILEVSEKNGQRLAVHCLAGIGRTSTMLLAAEIIRGKPFEDTLRHVQKQNPVYAFVGPQAEFIRNLLASK
jgi:protein-tyrosine phosphatase